MGSSRIRRTAPYLAVLACAASPAAANAAITTDSTPGPQALAEALAGPGVAVSNATATGDAAARGTFAGGAAALGIDQGIVLSSGRVEDIKGPNTQENRGTPFFGAGDGQLSALAGQSTSDASVLEFDFVPTKSSITFTYVFGSEEYDEFVDKGFNDAFGFFVNGQNCALTPGTGDPVTIDTINRTKNSALYRPNTNPVVLDTQLDGLTTTLTCEAQVAAGQTNRIKLAIADAGDSAYDSAVVLGEGSLVSNTPPVAALAATPAAPKTGEEVTFDTAGTKDGDDPALKSWELDFGDGTPKATGTGDPPATVKHTYGTAGAFTATLVVTDNQDATATATTALTVEEAKKASALAARPALLKLAGGLGLYSFNPYATLTRDGKPYGGAKVTFTANGKGVCTATTTATGVATCYGLTTLLDQVLGGGYVATFAGDAQTFPSSAKGPLIR